MPDANAAGQQMPTFIHPAAIVEAGAQLGKGVHIGPFCLIGPHVQLADGVHLHSHVVIAGRTRIGAQTRIFPFASIGHQPQDLKFRGEPSRLDIGSHCTIREGVTINPGTEQGGMLTQVGDRVLLMVNVHVAHDCQVGNDVIIANNVMLAGHCQIGDYAVLGGGAALHQFVRVGTQAMIGGLAGVENDVIPYGMVLGNRAALGGLNLVGLKRRGFSREAIHELRRAYRQLFTSEATLSERIEQVAQEFAGQPQVEIVLDFIRTGGGRALCTPRDMENL